MIQVEPSWETSCNPKSAFGILTSASFEDYFAAEVASHRQQEGIGVRRSGVIAEDRLLK